jgi:hypothetical protein
MGIVINFADINNDEVLLEVFPQDEEDSIVSDVYAHLQLLFRSYLSPKLFITFAGRSFPLHTSPRISDFKHAIGSIVNAKLCYRIDTIVYA